MAPYELHPENPDQRGTQVEASRDPELPDEYEGGADDGARPERDNQRPPANPYRPIFRQQQFDCIFWHNIIFATSAELHLPGEIDQMLRLSEGAFELGGRDADEAIVGGVLDVDQLA